MPDEPLVEAKSGRLPLVVPLQRVIAASDEFLRQPGADNRPARSFIEKLRKLFPNDKTQAPEPIRILLDISYLSEAHYNDVWKYLRDNCTAEELSRIHEIAMEFDA